MPPTPLLILLAFVVAILWAGLSNGIALNRSVRNMGKYAKQQLDKEQEEG